MINEKPGRTIFNALAEGMNMVNTGMALGQNKTIKKFGKAIAAYLNTRALETGLPVKIKSMFFNRGQSTLIIYMIKNGNMHYQVQCKRHGLANFTVSTADNDRHMETWIKKWLSVKIETELPIWIAAQSAQKAVANQVQYENHAPVIRRKTGSNYEFTRCKPGSDAHIARIDASK